MLSKYLKCWKPMHRLSNRRSKNLTMVKPEVSEAELNDLEDGDDE